MSADFTLILITKDRADITKCLDSIYNNMKKIKFKLIIIDGNSSDLLLNQIQKSYFKLHDIKVYKQRKGRFMRACFESIEYVQTKFFSFIYDDDVLSDKYYEIINCSLKNDMATFGKGSVEKINTNITFHNPVIGECSSLDKLQDYYSFSGFTNKNLPNSPICSIFKTNILIQWKHFLFRNCLKNKAYFDILLRKNIGPDLLLYLISLNKENKIKSTDTIMSKFSHHNNSMSVKYGSESLIFGYLITKIIFFKATFKDRKYFTRLKMKNYLIIQLFYIMIRNTFKKNRLNFKINRISLKEIYNLILL